MGFLTPKAPSAPPPPPAPAQYASSATQDAAAAARAAAAAAAGGMGFDKTVSSSPEGAAKAPTAMKSLFGE